MRGYLMNRQPSLSYFQSAGPFEFNIKQNYDIRIAENEVILSDLYIAKHDQKAPLLIFIHGNEGLKEAHRYQAMHAATFGFHCLVVQLENEDRWMKNGASLAKLVNLIYRWPDLVGDRIDVNRMILVGHSFGGSAITVAIGSGAPASGAILLDPAIVAKDVTKYLKQVNVPTILLGADEKVFTSRKRPLFYKNIPGKMAEFSLKDASHEDAQYPSVRALKYFGIDPFTSTKIQERFMHSIVLSAFSLAATGELDYAWNALASEVSAGHFLNARRK